MHYLKFHVFSNNPKETVLGPPTSGNEHHRSARAHTHYILYCGSSTHAVSTESHGMLALLVAKLEKGSSVIKITSLSTRQQLAR